MRSLGACLVSAVALTLAACSSSSTTAPAKVAKGGAEPQALQPAKPDEQPPFVFSPRPHPARVHEAPPAPPALADLPRMIDRASQCFAAPRDEWSSGGGGQGYGYGRGRVSPPTKAAMAPRPKALGGALGGGAYHQGLSGVGQGAGAPSNSYGSGASTGATAAPMASASTPATRSAPQPTSAPIAEPAEAKADAKKESPRADASRASGNKSKDKAYGSALEDDRTAQNERRIEAEEEKPAQIAKTPADPDDTYADWGGSIYLSNDDTMSLSSAQRVVFAIDQFLPLPAEHIRPHEMLNYFSFDTAQVPEGDDFSVEAALAPDPKRPGIATLALSVRGRPVDVDSRRNANLSIVIDRSGSMQDEGRMEYLKRGLLRMLQELKRGDVLSLVLFDDQLCTPIENFVVGRDSRERLAQVIQQIQPRGSTDLHLGLREGYRIADAAYQPTYTNRVMLITDALANTGVTDEEMIATIGKYYDARRIRLSGVGVGREFNDSLIDRLTERGRGAYVFLGSEAETDAVFGSRFVSMIETTANDVHFQLHLPPSLRMNVFYGEEASVVKEDVQAIHYFANTSQLFLSDLMAKKAMIRGQDDIGLTVEYEHPETGQKMLEEFRFPIREIVHETRNVRKGRLVMTFVDGLAELASRGVPSSYGSAAGSWDDPEAYDRCDSESAELRDIASGLPGDAEVTRVLGLWEKYCSRFERPRRIGRGEGAPEDRWPSATD